RFYDVRVLNRSYDLFSRYVVRDQPIGIDPHVKLARLSAGDTDNRHTRQACELRSNDVGGNVSEAGKVASVGSQAVARHGKNRERQSLNITNCGRRWQCCCES